ncbi:MAG: hypothetical protein HY775_12430 [Acidobacteria bacterium]|nr:hypothetical protein [Acidobacteriota bacterium]
MAPAASAASEPDARAGPGAPRVAYAFRDDLWIYDVAGDKRIRLTHDGEARTERSPRFRNAAVLSFAAERDPGDAAGLFGRDSLWEVGARGGRVREILRLEAAVLAHDWSPDGGRLAYLVSDGRSDQLCLYDASRGRTRLIRRLHAPQGREPGPDDDESLAWSPTGSALLVVDTFALAARTATVNVLNGAGRELVAASEGTFARWSADGRSVFFRELGYGTRGEWYAQGLSSGGLRRLGMRAGTFRADVSPDGRRLAYDDGAATPSIYVFDLESGGEVRVARGFLAPVWLGAEVVVATAAKGGACAPVCDLRSFTIRDTTVAFDVRTGARRRLSLQTTVPTPGFLPNLDVFGLTAERTSPA